MDYESLPRQIQMTVPKKKVEIARRLSNDLIEILITGDNRWVVWKKIKYRWVLQTTR